MTGPSRLTFPGVLIRVSPMGAPGGAARVAVLGAPARPRVAACAAVLENEDLLGVIVSYLGVRDLLLSCAVVDKLWRRTAESD